MRYALDTEFWERGRLVPTELISLGILSETGNSWYGVNKEFDWKRVPKDDWLQKNVRPYLDDPRKVQSRPLLTYPEMRLELLKFFKGDDAPVLWGYFADYDWQLFCGIFGRMIDMPKPFPHLCFDVEQERRSFGFSKNIFPVQKGQEHNALNDAQWTMSCVLSVEAHKKALLDRVGVGAV